MVKLQVKELAQREGWCLSQLQREAKLTTGMARRYWYGTKSGKAHDPELLTEINLEKLAAIAKVLNVQPGDLLVQCCS
jgi:DNA-binding Xre family transcriptional regulator